MSRNTKTRRKVRRARPKRTLIVPAKEPWGSGPPLTEQEWARVLARFGCLKGRSVTIGFTPMFGLVQASTPEELREAVRQKLLAESLAKPQDAS
jgi:hypothetical protein